MTAGKQYLQVKRVSLMDLFLLSQTDMADGRPFRPGDVVAACKACRRVSKREHWIKGGNSCPFCGGGAALPFLRAQDLTQNAFPPVVYSARWPFRLFSVKTAAVVLSLAALIFLISFLVSSLNRPRVSGFFINDDGSVYYQLEDGRRYQNGDYSINRAIYHFENGLLAGPGTFLANGVLYSANDEGVAAVGWMIQNGALVYQGENGLESNKVVGGAKLKRFVELEGLGRVFVDENGVPVQGWTAYDRQLYFFRDGQPDPSADAPGTFEKDGRFVPRAAGFLETENGTYYLDEAGRLQSGFLAVDGFVYLVDETTFLRRAVSSSDLEGFTTGASGALIPQEDWIIACQDGSVLIKARTGEIGLGWLIMDGHVYKTDEAGWLLMGQSSLEPSGVFDAKGRFIPSQPGRLTTDSGVCFLLADGTVASGCQKEGDALYLYDQAGWLQTNASISGVGGTDASGAVRPFVPGIYDIGGSVYCLSAQGTVLTGWQQNGRLYYFDPVTGRRANGSVVSGGSVYALTPEGYYAPPAEGAYSFDGDTYYVLSDGTLASGWRAVDGQMMYFDEKTGKRQETDFENEQGWISRSGARFYIFPDGTPARGWQIIDGKVYCFDLQTSAAITGTITEGGAVYRFREDGVLTPETPQAIIVNGLSYRIGVSGEAQGGALYRDGHLYWYGEDGVLSAQPPRGFQGWVSALGGYLIPAQEGVAALDGAEYYLTGAGDVLVGWFERDGQLYYAHNKNGQLGQDASLLGLDGEFQNGAFIPDEDGVFQIDGKEYQIEGGRLKNGWVALSDGVGYFQDGLGQAKSITIKLDNVFYPFDEEGRYVPSRGTVLQIGQEWIYITETGHFAKEAGICRVDNRFTAVDSRSRCSAEALGRIPGVSNARMQEGIILPIVPGLTALGEDRLYFLDENGNYQTGIRLIDGRLRLFAEGNGLMVRNRYGFNDEGVFIPDRVGINYIMYLNQTNAYWFYDLSGSVGTGRIVIDGEDNMVFANEQGELQSGVIDWNGAKYYFYDSDNDYLMAKDIMLTYRTDAGEYFEIAAGKDGALITGWAEVKGALRYFDENGHMALDQVVDGRYINIYGEAR